MSEFSPHSEYPVLLEQFADLDNLLTAILFASIIEGEWGVKETIDTHQEQFSDIQDWLPDFFQSTLHGWFLRQRSGEYTRQEEASLLATSQNQLRREISPFAYLGITDLSLDEELTTPQKMSMLTLGLLYNLKSVNYQNLNRVSQLGNHSGLSETTSSWMFNWQPEQLFHQLRWLQGTAQLILNDPVELSTKYTFQFLRFGHFVAALRKATDTRTTQMHRLVKRKQSGSSNNLSVFVPPGVGITPPPERTDVDSDPFTYNGTVPASFMTFINSLK